MAAEINTVAVIGAGTMGAGIAGVCAAAGSDVLLFDVDVERVQAAIGRLTGGRNPAITEEQAAKICACAIDGDIEQLAVADWICEVIIENLDAKRGLFAKVEAARKDGSIVTSNTSGIPLRDICADMPERFRRDVAVTHFFNPVHIMRLLELVPGEDTQPEAVERLVAYLGGTLGKGVVYAKDTVNFIGNRIGCFWMLAGLHLARDARGQGVSMERVDALMSKPCGLPPTGLYGLIDLIGLDVMDFVGQNLATNLPEGDIGRAYASFPAEVQAMFNNGQLGRKTGGGFYRVSKNDDGSKTKESYDLSTSSWRLSEEVELSGEHADYTTLLFADDAAGHFAWDLMGATLCYAADLVPEIADDIVNVDRAMRWGFNWAQGPFEMLDGLGVDKVIARLEAEGKPLPKMLSMLRDSGNTSFYRNDGAEFLGTNGQYHPVPTE
jgi:3-hydroxyacyl-CoA dehydrogenase